MILVALGSNQNGPWGTPRETVTRAIAMLDRDGFHLIAASRLIESRPFGKLNQPPFVNAVARVVCHAPADAVMRKLHAIERAAGRRRIERWGPRTLDLDLLDYHGRVTRPGSRLRLPHPGIAERIFVLKPIAEIAPRWKHPVSHRSACQLLRHLAADGEGGEI
ncbi:MAG: 2-amino-4-hydroxy-6-hydroxymethyldihydropteridine diphosphokinase [Alphaproteobacteria bacterium]|nr:2-amino-4-hydroxy-6-hydroxymethyldihydropteridine diphosphokinase [Alphaproteobacteria bacterium]